MTETPQPPASPEPPSVGPQPPAPAPAQGQGNGLAVAGMVLGIVALVLFCFWYIAIPCGVVGLILSIQGKKKAAATGAGAGMAKAGLILCIIALALDVLGAIFFSALILSMLGLAKEAAESSEEAMVILRSFFA